MEIKFKTDINLENLVNSDLSLNKEKYKELKNCLDDYLKSLIKTQKDKISQKIAQNIQFETFLYENKKNIRESLLKNGLYRFLRFIGLECKALNLDILSQEIEFYNFINLHEHTYIQFRFKNIPEILYESVNLTVQFSDKNRIENKLDGVKIYGSMSKSNNELEQIFMDVVFNEKGDLNDVACGTSYESIKLKILDLPKHINKKSISSKR